MILTCCLAPTSFVPGILLVNSINPMQILFIKEFSVENQSGEAVSVTPIGTFEIEDHRQLLPLFISKFPAFWKLKRNDFQLLPDENIKLKYSMEDITLTEIAVTDHEGEYHQLTIEYDLNQDHFVIPPLTELDPIAPNVLEAATFESRKFSRLIFWLINIVGITWPFLYWRLKKQYEREKLINQSIKFS